MNTSNTVSKHDNQKKKSQTTTFKRHFFHPHVVFSCASVAVFCRCKLWTNQNINKLPKQSLLFFFFFLSRQFPVSVHHRTASLLQLGVVERGEQAGRWEAADTVHQTAASKTLSISLPSQAPPNHPSLKQITQGLLHPFLKWQNQNPFFWKMHQNAFINV